jgi:SAM-dependent methyltransferase
MVTGFLTGRFMSTTQGACDFCGKTALTAVYKPEGTARSLTVHLCSHCGLVQSLPRVARTAQRHEAAVSGGADWGNVRYGKGFRTDVALEAIARQSDLAAPLKLLDVGSNRGSFAKAFLAAAPNAQITALEPDERFAASCADLPRTELIQARIEDTALPDGGFDIVHSCHTIEHLAAPFAALKDHARTLKPGGILVLDAPNIALIGGRDILEEWFIDKHLYHFSATTLGRMIEAAGFEILREPDPADDVNLLFVARKTGALPFAATLMKLGDPMEVGIAGALLQRYQAMRLANLAALHHAAAAIRALAPRRVALWGAGRLFDLLVREGGFDPRMLSLLIDAHLQKHMDERHGVRLSAPEALAEIDAVIVMSRMFAGEISREVKMRVPNAEIILYADLLESAKARKAA